TIGDNAVLKIQLSAVSTGGYALNVHGNGSTVRGLVLNGVQTGNYAIGFGASDYISPNDYHLEGCFIGTDVSGSTVVGGGPGTTGVEMDADFCTIGVATPDTRNVIAGFDQGIDDG